MGNPYVISAELDLADPKLDRILISERIDDFRSSLDAELRGMGKEVVWVPSNTIKSFLDSAIAKTSLPVLSLDDRYVTNADQYIGISRGVKDQTRYEYGPPIYEDVGYVSREGYQDIKTQLNCVTWLGDEIVLADDVIFSGEMIVWLTDELAQKGIKVQRVLCGISTQEGIDKLSERGIAVDAGVVFDELEDEICERDFTIVPGSGRRIDDPTDPMLTDWDGWDGKSPFTSLPGNVLYFDSKFGMPEQWASIPKQYEDDFCVNSLERTMKLLRPALPMRSLGNFVGFNYWRQGEYLSVVQYLRRVLEEGPNYR
jgi:hypothetical protein